MRLTGCLACAFNWLPNLVFLQTMQEVLRLHSPSDVEWSYIEKDLPGVIIHDKLMTDAALGTRPIKTEHSYSLASDGDSLPDSPISHNKLEGEC